MVNEELEAHIRAMYQEGMKRDAIKLTLQEQGWAESEIETAIAHIQRDAVKQLPIISHVYQSIEKLEKKTAQASYKTVAGVLAGSSIIVLLLFAGLYMYLDPLGVQSADRDKLRETDIIKLRNAVASFYSSTGAYPVKLEALVPTYLPSLPQDPKSRTVYAYTQRQNGANYELCVTFETQPSQCLSPEPSETSIPVVVTPFTTPVVEEPVDAGTPSAIINKSL